MKKSWKIPAPKILKTKKKNNPERTCVVCGCKRHKTELVRLVYSAGIIVDRQQVHEGRGRYICAGGCRLNTGDTKILKRVFRNNSISTEDIGKLLEELAERF